MPVPYEGIHTRYFKPDYSLLVRSQTHSKKSTFHSSSRKLFFFQQVELIDKSTTAEVEMIILSAKMTNISRFVLHINASF